MSRSPIIIIGSHRSGTGMIASMLEQLGLFVGKQKESNHEALFFLDLNDWLLHQAGGSWDYPQPFLDLLDNAAIRKLIEARLRFLMTTVQAASYLGIRRYVRYQNPANLDIPWGWKDPRNTYTLPLWLNLFPNARVIHVFRHGVDVASSLWRRTQSQIMLYHDRQERLMRHPLLWWLYFRRRSVRLRRTPSLRCASLENCFILWEMYLEQCKAHIGRLGENAIEVQYERFLSAPLQELGILARFCGLDVDDRLIQNVATSVTPSRAYAYKRDPNLQAFAKKVANRLAAQGY